MATENEGKKETPLIEKRITNVPGTAGRGVPLASETVEAFLYDGASISISSGTIVSATFDNEEHKLILIYNNGAAWEYFPVDVPEALSFAQASSKGEWSWSYLRIRGTRQAHKKGALKLN